MEELPEIVHCTQVRVRYADTDQMGVVYYAAYLVYFEVGRTELLRACGVAYRELERTRYQPRYEPRLRLEYEVLRQQQRIAIGYTLHAFMDARRWRPVRPPKFFWEALRQRVKQCT